MTIIVPNGRPLDGAPANPTSSRRLDRFLAWAPQGRDGDRLYKHLGADQTDEETP